MFIHAMPPQLNTQSTRQPFGKQQVGLKPIASVTMRSGTNEAVADSFYASLKSTVDQAKAFLATAPAEATPKELEAQFLANLLSQHLKAGKNIDGTTKTDLQALSAFKTMNEKLLTYLQADDLAGALRLLDGSHQPLENEFTGKYNFFKGWQNKMQAIIQEQPKHKIETKLVRPEFDSIEAFEAYIKEVRSQFQSCLAKVETPQGGAIIPRTNEAIATAKAAATELLAEVQAKLVQIYKGEIKSDKLLEKAIVHNVKTSEASQEMLTRAWIEKEVKLALETVKKQTGFSPQDEERVIDYLKGLFLTLGGETATQGQLALAGLPSENSGSIVLAPVTKKIVDELTGLKGKALAIHQFSLGLPDALLKQLPDEFWSVNKFKEVLAAFQASLRNPQLDSPVITLAKSLLSKEAETGLIKAYQLHLAQQDVALERRLIQLDQPPPTVKLPAFLERLSETQQHRLQDFLLQVAHLPPVEQAKQLKQLLSEIPQDMRKTLKGFIKFEQKRWNDMKALGTIVAQQAQKVAEKKVTMLQEEVFNLPFAKKHFEIFTTQMTEAVAEIPKAFAEMTTQPPQTSVRKSEIKLPSNEGVVFAEPLRVVEKQAEKTEWFPALIEHNKAWLPWVGAGTVALGLLAGVAWWASNRKAPKQEAKN